jgi:hypothetical protein
LFGNNVKVSVNFVSRNATSKPNTKSSTTPASHKQNATTTINAGDDVPAWWAATREAEYDREISRVPLSELVKGLRVSSDIGEEAKYPHLFTDETLWAAAIQKKDYVVIHNYFMGGCCGRKWPRRCALPPVVRKRLLKLSALFLKTS